MGLTWQRDLGPRLPVARAGKGDNGVAGASIETGHEDFMTGGWVRVLATAEQARRKRRGMEKAARRGLVAIHGAREACCWWSSWTPPLG